MVLRPGSLGVGVSAFLLRAAGTYPYPHTCPASQGWGHQPEGQNCLFQTPSGPEQGLHQYPGPPTPMLLFLP